MFDVYRCLDEGCAAQGDLKCLNGGVCINGFCQCQNGFTGSECGNQKFSNST
jgi:hypothetical protein